MEDKAQYVLDEHQKYDKESSGRHWSQNVTEPYVILTNM